jgi:HPr kinase/phosphorylase
MEDLLPTNRKQISVADFAGRYRDLFYITELSEPAVGHKHFLDSPRVQKLGLALSGFAGRIHKGRIQIYGNSERTFLDRLSTTDIDAAFARLDRDNISCILVTADIEPDERLVSFAQQNEIPLFRVVSPSSEVITALTKLLGEMLAPSTTVHGVLVSVLGVGVLLLGESGIGKSECALDLIGRGQRLISDDAVVLERIGNNLIGKAPETIRDFLEIRGLGVINARELFGVSALASSARIELCINLCLLSETASADRLGLEQTFFEALEIEIPKYDIPVMPGRNLATLVEAAVRVYVSRRSGSAGVEELVERHNATLSLTK